MTLEEYNNLRPEDEIIVSNPECNLSHFTFFKTYRVVNFYSYKYGVILINDRGDTSEVCKDYILNHFSVVNNIIIEVPYCLEVLEATEDYIKLSKKPTVKGIIEKYGETKLNSDKLKAIVQILES